MKNVVVRSISGIAYIAIIVAAICCGVNTFFPLLALLAVLGILEFTHLFGGPCSWPLVALDALAAVSCTLLGAVIIGAGFWASLAPAAGFYLLVYFIARMVLALFDLRGQALASFVHSIAGVVYIGLPLMCLGVLYLLFGEASRWLVLEMFILIWLNDTGAFCFGSTLGKRKLCERLSPKKSWEGFWGGLGCCAVAGVIFWYGFNYTGFSLPVWIVLGILVSLFATWGDLFESLIKRSMHVKDSGHLIPGHGGILDRIDSLLLVAPAILVYLFVLIAFGWV